jgi:hypothetical protein
LWVFGLFIILPFASADVGNSKSKVIIFDAAEQIMELRLFSILPLVFIGSPRNKAGAQRMHLALQLIGEVLAASPS